MTDAAARLRELAELRNGSEWNVWSVSAQDFAALADEVERLEVVRDAARFPNNVLMYKVAGFEGEWVAVPAATFRILRAALAAAEEEQK